MILQSRTYILYHESIAMARANARAAPMAILSFWLAFFLSSIA